MNSKLGLTGVSLLFLATLAACGGGGGDGGTAGAPPANNSGGGGGGNLPARPNNVAGFVYATNALSSNVSAYTIDSATGALSEVSGSPFATGSNPKSVTVAPSGKFAYVANAGSDKVSAYTVNTTTGALTGIGAAVAGVFPVTVTVDPSGKFVYVANAGSDDVSAYTINTTTGALSEVAGPFAAGFGPRGVAVHPSGKFAYVANEVPTSGGRPGSVSVYTIHATTGVLSEIAGSPFETGRQPTTFTVDPSGRFAYVATSDLTFAYTINDATGALTEIAGSPFNYAGLLTFEPSGKFVYGLVFDEPQQRFTIGAHAMNTSTGAFTSIGAAVPPQALGGFPVSISVEPSGKFVYAAIDGGSNNVWAFSINTTTGTLTSVGAAVSAGTSPTSITITRRYQ